MRFGLFGICQPPRSLPAMRHAFGRRRNSGRRPAACAGLLHEMGIVWVERRPGQTHGSQHARTENTRTDNPRSRLLRLARLASPWADCSLCPGARKYRGSAHPCPRRYRVPPSQSPSSVHVCGVPSSQHRTMDPSFACSQGCPISGHPGWICRDGRRR